MALSRGTDAGNSLSRLRRVRWVWWLLVKELSGQGLLQNHFLKRNRRGGATSGGSLVGGASPSPSGRGNMELPLPNGCRGSGRTERVPGHNFPSGCGLSSGHTH